MGKKRKDIKSIFSEALEKRTAKERAAYLDRVCGDDSDLRAEFESLLKEHDEAGSFLNGPPVGIDSTLGAPPLTEGPGTKIGRYKLLQLIGEGGFGVVYMAEQEEPIRRRVALKIIKLGMDTKQVIARFEAERQALAMMDHPNIARVFDAGATDTGRPYFVMELVKGIPITEYCDKNNLDTRQRLDLFIDVCKAVQHAHQKGIIHRDIKPSNVMITLHDGKPVPKIIDFGIAKATQHRLTEKTLFTEYRQLIGTPEYMSPEQAEMSGLDVDTRSDIYSLGVLLYELLTGTTPFEAEKLRSAAYDEIRRIICEDEPPKPSTRLNTLGDALSDVAKHRHVQPDQLCKIVRGDLDWVVMRALEKDRTRRYETANEFATDIELHLGDEPVSAGPPSVGYRLRKFVRRNRALVTATAAVAAAIIVGFVVSTVMYLQAEQAREKEATARVQAEQAREKEATARAQAEQAREKETVARTRAEQAEEATKEKAEELRRTLYVNSIQLADAKYGEGNIRRVRELLELCPDDLRGWEWYRLNHISDQAQMTLQGHKSGVWSVAFSPDGKRIVSGSKDQTVRLWDASTGASLLTLRGHQNTVIAAAFSPDGKRLTSASRGGITKIWDLESGYELMNLDANLHTQINDTWSYKFPYIKFAALSPDGKYIAASCLDNTVKVWDAATGAEVMALRGHDESATAVAFSPDGKRIVSADDTTIKVWTVAGGAEPITLRGHESGVLAVAFSPDGKRIAAACWDHTAKVWDTSTGSGPLALEHKEMVTSVAFSPDGKRLASGSSDTTIKVWDVEGGTELNTLRGHAAGICSVAFSPDGKKIASGSMDNTIKVWAPDIDHECMTLQVRDYEVDSIAFSPDGKRIVSSSKHEGIKAWDPATGAELMTLRGLQGGGTVIYSPDGERIIAADGNDIKVCDASNGNELMSLSGHEGAIWSMSYSPDGTRIASGSQDGTIKIWDVVTGAELMALGGHTSWIRAVAFSPDGKRIVSGSENGTIKVWDTGSGAEVMTLHGNGTSVSAAGFRRVNTVTFSPDGKHIASASFIGGNTIRIWDAASGVEVKRLRGHRRVVISLTFSPNGKRIVSGSSSGTLKVWDIATGAEVMTLRRRMNGYVGCIQFSPDGQTIAASGGGSTVKLWESAAPPGGYGPRKTAEAARKVVDELYKETGFYSEVIDKLNADKTLAEPVCKVALQIANARLWEDAEKVNKQASDSGDPVED